VLACGQRALARVSYMTSTRAMAQLTPNQTDQYYTGKLTFFAPGLTHGRELRRETLLEPKTPNAAPCTFDAKGGLLMGWMAPAPTDVAMRHTAGVEICN